MKKKKKPNINLKCKKRNVKIESLKLIEMCKSLEKIKFAMRMSVYWFLLVFWGNLKRGFVDRKEEFKPKTFCLKISSNPYETYNQQAQKLAMIHYKVEPQVQLSPTFPQQKDSKESYTNN